MQVFTLSKKDIEQFIDIPEIIRVIEQAFADYNSGNVTLAPISNLSVEDNGEVHIKAGHIHGYKNYCIKIAGGFYGNVKLGLPSLFGIMLLYDAKTGRLSSQLFDQGLLTTLRTAAAGAIAAKHLAKKSINAAGIIGMGTQGKMQMQFLAHIRTFKKLYIWDVNQEFVETSKQELGAQLPGIEIIEAGSPSEVASCVDVLVTATPARKPVVFADDLHPGLHITAMGSDDPVKQEIDAAVFKNVDKIVVDRIEQSATLGELHHAINAGTATRENVNAELGELVLGKYPGRESEKEITICDLTGMAVQDIAISVWAKEQADKRNLGKMLEV